MNNSKLAIDDLLLEEKVLDTTPILRQRQTEVIKIIEALQSILNSEQWQVLKELVFNGLVDTLEKRLVSETIKKPLDVDEIHRLNGQLIWAKRYADLNKLMEVYRLELTNLRSKLNANN